MKILYIDTPDSFEKIRIEGQSIFYKELPKFGNEVFFLIAENKNGKNEQINIYTYKSNILTKVLFNIPLLIAINRIYIKNRIEIIAVRNSTSLGFISLLYAKSKQILFLYLKPFPLTELMKYESKVSNKIFHKVKRNVQFIVNNLLENFILRKSDIIIPITNEYLNYLNIHKKIDKQKMFSVPMGFDSDALKNLDDNKITEIRKKYCPTSEILLLYFGEFHQSRNLKFIVDVFENAIKIITNLRLLMIGGNFVDHSDLLEYISKKGLQEQIHLIASIPRDILYNYIAASDLTISPIPPLFIYRLSSPTKVIESLGFGIPVIVNEEIEDQRQIIDNSKGGKAVPYDEESFSNAIIHLLSNTSILKEMGRKGQNYILENRSYAKLAKDLNSFIINHKMLIS